VSYIKRNGSLNCCTNTMTISEVNTNYTTFISTNISFLDTSGGSNNGWTNPHPTEYTD
jgi:hypothetical protein